MKFDGKARWLLLYILLPVYLVTLGVFIFVSNVYRGRYPLPEDRISAEFVDFGETGYILAQSLTVRDQRIEPGTVIDTDLAEQLVGTLGILGRHVVVVEPPEEFSPESAPAVEATRIAGPDRYLVHSVTVGPANEGVSLDAGSAFTRNVAARVEQAAAAADYDGEVTAASASRIAVPESTESAEFTSFIDGEYLLDETVTIRIDGDEVVKEEGTVISREILLGLMRMRDRRLRGDTVMVRGQGPVIGFQYTFVFIALNFFILVTFLYGLLWKPIITVLDKRAEQIRGDLTDARDHRKKARSLFEKYKDVMEGSRKEHDELIAEGRSEGQKERERIIAEARAEAESYLEHARLSIRTERQELRRELTGQVGTYSVRLAEKILAREIRSEDHEELIRAFVSGISSSDEAGEDSQDG